MKTTVEYLRAAKDAAGLESDYALSKAIGVNRATISLYMSGDRTMDDYTALKVAQILGIDPIEVIAAANHERERTAERREAWENLWNATARIGRAASLAVLALGILMAIGTTGSDSVRNEGAAVVPAVAQATDLERIRTEFRQGGVIRINLSYEQENQALRSMESCALATTRLCNSRRNQSGTSESGTLHS